MLSAILCSVSQPDTRHCHLTPASDYIPYMSFLCTIDVKNVFYVFLFLPRFLTFFILKKTCIENPFKSFVKHFWDHRNELISHSDVVYLVSPNALNKMFLSSIFG